MKISFQRLSAICCLSALVCVSALEAVEAQGSPPNAGPINAIQEQLTRIEDNVGKIENVLDDVAGVNRSACDRPYSWNRKLPGAGRFVVALNGNAYCDLETGLVWDRSPKGRATWRGAYGLCANREIDGRLGWSLPTVQQLSSLVDRLNTGPALPSGHPFEGVLSDLYWTSTPQEVIAARAYFVDFGSGAVGTLDTFGEASFWCVRGGQTSTEQIPVPLD